MARNEKRIKLIMTVALAIVAIVLIAILAVAFLPLKGHSEDVLLSTGGQEGTDTVMIDAVMNLGDLEVRFVPLEGQAVRMHAAVNAHIGALDPSNILEATLTSYAQGNVCMVSAKADIRQNLLFNSDVKVKNILEIDPRYATAIQITLGTGSIEMDTQGGVELVNVSIVLKTGSISLVLADDTSIDGDLVLESSVGSIAVDCRNVTFNGTSQSVRTATSTGSVEIACDISAQLSEQVQWDIETKTGSIELDIVISDRLAAELVAECNVGTVNVATVQNFQVIHQSETDAKYQSMNYGSEDGIIFDASVTGVGSIEAHLVQV